MAQNYQSKHYERTFSLAEIAQYLNRPATTVSTWRTQYKEFIDAATIGSGRSKRYKKEAFDIFKLIDEMKTRNEPHEMIRRALTDTVDEIIVDNDDQEKPALIGEILEGYQNVLSVLKEQKEGIDELRKENEQLRNQLSQIEGNQQSQQEQARIQEERIAERDRRLMETLNAIQTEKNKKQEGLFKRLFSKHTE